jgi:hypothetical protein
MGAGCADAIDDAIDQIFSFAASMRPLMLPVVSSTNSHVDYRAVRR